MRQDNLTSVLAKFAKQLNFPIKYQAIYDELHIHPDYPSLLAISDVLETFNIPNAAFKIENDQLKDVPLPFIVHNRFTKIFSTVNKIDSDNLFITDEQHDNFPVPRKQFDITFSGVVLTAEPSAIASKSANRVFSTIKTPLLIGLALLILLAVLVFHTGYFNALTWQGIVLTVFKTAGLATSILLIIQSIDTNNPLIQKICTGGGKTDCNAILSSNAAKVFEGLTWSEVGLYYFAGTWLLLLFNGSSAAIWQALLFLNVVSLPYTVYSIYYQARVAKKWCVLCCTVQALLWLEFIPLLTGFHQPVLMPGIGVISSVFIAFAGPVIIWQLLKPLLLAQQQIDPLKKQLQATKFNLEVFNNLLTANSKFAQPGEDWSIVLGNVEADNIITMVTNPYCPPCASMHKLLDELLEQRKNLQARIVFTADNTDQDIKTPVARHLMTLHGLEDKSIVKNALNDWYTQKKKDYVNWAKNYPVELNETEYNKINKQNAWCNLVEIKGTPTVLLNGYVLPGQYQLSDLKYLLG